MNFCGIDEQVDATALFHYRNGHDSGFPTMRHRGDQPQDVDHFREYQGELTDEQAVANWDGHPLFRYGSHLYWHVVSVGATVDEFTDSYLRNQERLSSFRSSTALVAFPFGQPGLHYEDEHVSLARQLGATRVFSARARVNRGPLDFTVDRVALSTILVRPGGFKTILQRELFDRVSGG